MEIFERWKGPLQLVVSAGQLMDVKHSDSESHSDSPRVTQHRDDRNMAGAEEACGDVLASEAAQLRRGKVRAQASWSEASGSCSHLAPVSLVLFAASWQPATSKPRARFSRHRMFQVLCPHD